ncbi:MAG: alpha/beta hydrolase, partial [Deltaproteobacteria bacterium]
MCPDVTLAPATLARIKRVVPISPLGDLRPLIDTSMNETLRLTDETAVAESPTLGKPRMIDCEIWVGEAERPAFVTQAQELHQAWPASRLVIDEGRHHFDIIDALEQPHSRLTNALVKGLI